MLQWIRKKIVVGLFVLGLSMMIGNTCFADGAVQGHEEILKLDRQLASTGLTEAEVRDYIPIQYSVNYNYAEAYKLVEMVNQLRSSQGRSPLIATDYLMQIGMDRAAQMKVFSEHIAIIPNYPYSSSNAALVYPYYDQTILPVDFGENLTSCGPTDEYGNVIGEAADAYDMFGGNDHQGLHYANMIKSNYKYIGIGIVDNSCVMVFYDSNIEKSPTFDPNGEYGKLGNGSGEYRGYTPRKLARGYIDSAFFSNKDSADLVMLYNGRLCIKDDYISVGDSYTLSFAGKNYWNINQFAISSSDSSVVAVDGYTFTAKSAGKAIISVYYIPDPSLKVSATITVKAKDEDKKDKDGKSKVTVDLIYSKAVIDKESKTAEFTGMNKKYAKNLAGYTMPNTISYNGKSYKVTSIGNNAFKNCKNLKKITIPKNIKTIGSNAFRGCSKLQTITVQSTKITKAGKNAFKGIKKNAKIKVPKKKLAAYKKLMKGKGQKVKVVKK